MIARLLAVTLVLVGLPMLPALANRGPGDGAWTVRSAEAAAPAATDLTELAFSEAVNDQREPINPRTEFADPDQVWVSFGYRNHDPNVKVSYLVRANGEDFRWGDLDCCGGREGRFAFPIERRSGRELGGAAYEVRIYMGEAEVAHGGFGVRGREGFDSDNQDSDNQDSGNDND